jgi:hypothetical protein
MEFKPSFKQLLQKTKKLLNADNNVNSKRTDKSIKRMTTENNFKPMAT